MNKPNLSWNSLFIVTFLAACLYVFSEWLFAVTKPSYLNNLAFLQQIHVLLVTSFLFAGLCLLGLLSLATLSQISPLKSHTTLFIQIGAWLPAVVFAALILLLVDNFTYTLFKFGIISTESWERGLYGLGFLVVIVLCYRRTLRILRNLVIQIGNRGFAWKWGLGLLAGMILSLILTSYFSSQPMSLPINTTSAGERPHILLITSDGIDAIHTSAYDYKRDTTPRLQELAESALVAENAFSNSGNTAGAIISIYTGKYPARTRVLNKPDILKEQDAYEHLPGILRAQGYKTIQITMPYYLDANEYNVLGGFDEVMIGSTAQSKYLDKISKILPNESAFFTDSMIKRIADRVRHIFFIRKMINPYLLVTQPSGTLVDLERLEALKQFIRSTSQPIFIHVHFMGTHGDKFDPRVRIFSADQSIDNQEPWDDDFYDDSIRDFDNNLGNLVDFLSVQGLLDNTILIVGSDHGQRWDQLKRVPLIIRFPHGQYAGKIRVNVQGLDIPVTILDFIGLDKPDWMSGNSLIGSPLEQRPIFGVNTFEREQLDNGFFGVNWDNLDPPFYQFSDITMIYCSKWYKLGLTENSWDSGNVLGSTSNCPPGSEITDEEAFQWMVGHLRENGFDVSTLKRTPQ